MDNLVAFPAGTSTEYLKATIRGLVSKFDFTVRLNAVSLKFLPLRSSRVATSSLRNAVLAGNRQICFSPSSWEGL